MSTPEHEPEPELGDAWTLGEIEHLLGKPFLFRFSQAQARMRRISRDKLAKIQSDRANYQYAYITEGAIMDEVARVLSPLGILFVPVTPHAEDDFYGPGENTRGNVTRVAGSLRFIDALDESDVPRELAVPFIGYGIDDRDKGIAKAETAGIRRVLNRLFLQGGSTDETQHDSGARPSGDTGIGAATQGVDERPVTEGMVRRMWGRLSNAGRSGDRALLGDVVWLATQGRIDVTHDDDLARVNRSEVDAVYALIDLPESDRDAAIAVGLAERPRGAKATTLPIATPEPETTQRAPTGPASAPDSQAPADERPRDADGDPILRLAGGTLTTAQAERIANLADALDAEWPLPEARRDRLAGELADLGLDPVSAPGDPAWPDVIIVRSIARYGRGPFALDETQAGGLIEELDGLLANRRASVAASEGGAS